VFKLCHFSISIETTLSKVVGTNAAAAAGKPIFSSEFFDPYLLSAGVDWKP
jgi:hypothetical protein